MRKTIYILILAFLVSCTKEGGSAGKLMEFSVSTPGVVSTKAEATLDGLKGTGSAVYVYGTKSDGSNSLSVFDAPGTALLTNDSSTGMWKPSGKDYNWSDDMYYQFYGYAYGSDVNTNNLTIPNETYGRQFTVTQPETGDGSNTIDYLLSYMVNIPPTTNHPLVPIRLEHAMAKVEVDVQIAGAMYDNTECLVDNINISVSGIKRKATMLCVQPKLDGEEGTNTWQVTFEDNAGTATYTNETISNTKEDNLSGTNAVAPDMSFIAVPVTNEQMGDYMLKLSYHGTITDTYYEYTFNLKDFSPKGWVNGHKVRYILTIDNSIHLAGSIVDYEDVDYIEAVIVPGQENNVQNP